MGFFKKIGKFFKKVVKSKVFKIVAAVVGVGAAIFTGGAALGLSFAAGGWGAAAAGVSNVLGLTGTTVGSILTGALTQAGYGALLGAGTSLVTGGNVLEGAAGGALGGAITGGVMGGLGFGTDPLAGAFDSAPKPDILGGGAQNATAFSPASSTEGFGLGASNLNLPSATPGFEASAGEFALPDGGARGLLGGGATPSPTMGATRVAGQAPGAAAAAAAPQDSMLSGLLNNETLGRTIAGVGKGLLTGSGVEDQIDAQEREERRLRDSYSGVRPVSEGRQYGITNPNARTSYRQATGVAQSSGAKTPRYRYDRERGEIVRG